MIERLIENLPGGSCGWGPVTQRLAHEASCSQVDFQHKALLYFSDIWILMPHSNVFKRNHLLPLRLILYLAQRGETVFSPVLLLEVTVAELISSVAELLQVDDFVKSKGFLNTQPFPQVPVGLFNKVIIVGPKKIQIKLTDDFLRYQRPDSAFHYNLVHEEGTCTIQMEPVHD